MSTSASKDNSNVQLNSEPAQTLRRPVLIEAPDRGGRITEAPESRLGIAEAPDAGEGSCHSHIDDF